MIQLPRLFAAGGALLPLADVRGGLPVHRPLHQESPALVRARGLYRGVCVCIYMYMCVRVRVRVHVSFDPSRSCRSVRPSFSWKPTTTHDTHTHIRDYVLLGMYIAGLCVIIALVQVCMRHYGVHRPALRPFVAVCALAGRMGRHGAEDTHTGQLIPPTNQPTNQKRTFPKP